MLGPLGLGFKHRETVLDRCDREPQGFQRPGLDSGPGPHLRRSGPFIHRVCRDPVEGHCEAPPSSLCRQSFPVLRAPRGGCTVAHLLGVGRAEVGEILTPAPPLSLHSSHLPAPERRNLSFLPEGLGAVGLRVRTILAPAAQAQRAPDCPTLCSLPGLSRCSLFPLTPYSPGP